MQLPNTKMLFTTYCDKLLSRNGSTNQHLWNPNLFTYRTPSRISNRSSSQFIKSRSRLPLHADKQLNYNCKPHFDNKHYWKSSIVYNCKRHYIKYLNAKCLNVNQRFIIDQTKVNDFKNGKNAMFGNQVFNQYSTSENELKLANKLHDQTSERRSSQKHDSTVVYNKLNLDQSLNQSTSIQKSTNSSSTDQIHQINRPNQQQTISNQHNYTDLINIRSIYRNNLFNQNDQENSNKMNGVSFKPKRALILTKFSRLEYERRRLVGFTEEEVKESLIRRGSDYESLLNHHNIHTNSKEHVSKTLSDFGIEHRIVNRFEYNQEQIDWADVIITTGGDGTFLMAASKIFSKDKLVIGINSDPSRSVGYLCLQPSYSVNFKAALEKLSAGDFRWVYRQRIRISVKGENAMDAPAELHDQQLLHPEFRYLDLETHPLNRRSNSPNRPDNFEYEYQVLPVRALNDVFVGECLSSRVSYFELKIQDLSFVKVKSSGVTICTGTGSTSWSFNINKISPQSVSTLFKIINEETNASLDASDEQLTKSITKKFNDSLIFNVCKNSMAYTVRDPVYMGNGFDTDNRGFAKNIVVKSRMFDACVVIDGGLSYKFNDGAYAKFELLDEDQLKTVAF